MPLSAVVGQIPATRTNDAGGVGSVGEHPSATVLAGGALALSTGIAKTITSITLTPGDWDVRGTVFSFPAGATIVSLAAAGLSLVTNTMPTLGEEGQIYIAGGSPTATLYSLPTGVKRFSVAVDTPVYLVAQFNFSVSTATAYGQMSARRIR